MSKVKPSKPTPISSSDHLAVLDLFANDKQGTPPPGSEPRNVILFSQRALALIKAGQSVAKFDASEPASVQPSDLILAEQAMLAAQKGNINDARVTFARLLKSPVFAVNLACCEFYFARGKHEACIALMRLLESRAMADGNTLMAALARLWLAWTYDRVNEMKLCLESGLGALELFRRCGSPPEEVDALTMIASAHYDAKKYKKAEDALHQAMTLGETLGCKAEQSRAYSLFADVCRCRLKMGKAETFYKMAVEAARESGDVLALVDALHSLGDHHFQIRLNFVAAQDCYQSAMKLVQPIGDRPRIAVLQSAQTALRKQLQDIRKSERFLASFK